MDFLLGSGLQESSIAVVCSSSSAPQERVVVSLQSTDALAVGKLTIKLDCCMFFFSRSRTSAASTDRLVIRLLEQVTRK